MNPRDFRQLPQRPDHSELVSRFVSLGLNCEFGLVQRHCMAEPMGLLRFAFTPFPGLLDALRHRFAGVGDSGQLSITLTKSGEYVAADTRYGFDFHTQMRAPACTEDQVRSRMCRHFAYLAGLLIDELTLGEKIFVYRPLRASEPHATAHKLLACLRRYGPGRLLWVGYSDDPAKAGDVAWLVPGEIMVGLLDHYTPPRYAVTTAFETWLKICRGAAAL
jgi:hypothetical protein